MKTDTLLRTDPAEAPHAADHREPLGVRANVVWYALPRFFWKGLSIVLVPLYTRLLPPAEMGQAVVALAVTGALYLVMAPGMEGAYLRWASAQSAEGAPGAGTLPLLHLAILVAGSVMLLAWAEPITELLLPGIPAWPFYYVVVLSVGLGSLGAPLRAGWRAQHRADYVMQLESIQVAISTGTILFALLVLRWGAVSLLLGELMASICLLPLYAKKFLAVVAQGWRKAALPVVLPIVFVGFPLSVSVWALASVDRILLNRLAGTAEAGLYGVGYQVAAALMLVGIVLDKEWQPLVFNLAQERVPRVDVLQQLWTRSVSLFLVMGSLLALFSRDIVRWVLGPAYLASAMVIPWVVIVAVLKVPYSLFIHVGLARGRARDLTVGSLLAVAVFVAGNLWLIPRAGAVGAAWAGILAYSASCLFLFSRPWNVYRLDPGVSVLIALFAGAVLLGSCLGGTAASRLAGAAIVGLLCRNACGYWKFLDTIRIAT